MTRDRLWLALAFLLPALAATIAPMSTVDLAYQVRAGELMLAGPTILREDPFTFTAMGEPWLNQQWGAGVLLAIGHGLGGWGGLVVLRAVLVGLAVLLVALGARRWLTGRSAALLALAGFIVGIASLGLRAQLFGILLFAAVLAILAWRDRHPRLLWTIPVLVLLWANLHGSFFLGPAAVAVALVEDWLGRRSDARRAAELEAEIRRLGVAPHEPAPPGPRRPVRQMAIVLGVSLVATCITPFGPWVWQYALGIATNPEITRLITEWQRTSPFSVTGLLFYLSAVGVGALVFVAWRWRLPISAPAIAWLLGLVLLGAYAERGVAWWAFGAPVAIAPLVAAVLADRRAQRGEVPLAEGHARARESRRLRVLNLIVVGALVAAVIALQPAWRPTDQLTGPAGLLRDAPGGVAAALAEVGGPEDRAVVPQPWASWLEWAAPGVPVMVDSRVEVVPASAWEEYARIAGGGQDALVVLRGIGATLVVVDPATQPALELALRTPGSAWRVAYDGDDGLVFELAQ